MYNVYETIYYIVCCIAGLVIKIFNLSLSLEGKDSVILLGSQSESSDLYSRTQDSHRCPVINALLFSHPLLSIRPNQNEAEGKGTFDITYWCTFLG